MTGLEAAFAALVLAAVGRWLKRVAVAVMLPWKQWGHAPDPVGVRQHDSFWRSEVDGLVDWLQDNAVGGEGVSASGEVRRHLDTVRNLLVRVPDEVFEDIRRELVQGHNQGDPVRAIADKVERILDVSGSENWRNRAQTIAVTECLPGDAVVDSARITAVYRRRYEGQWVKVQTEAGSKLSGTPNHPVLTNRGWVNFGQLDEGDYLICDRGKVQDGIVPGDPDVQAAPSTIAQVFDALAAVILPARVRTGQPDFHGDGLDGYVDVLRPDSPLLLGTFEPICEHRVQGVLEGSDVQAVLLSAQCHGFPVDLGLRALDRLTKGAQGHFGRLQDADDGLPVDTEALAQLAQGFASAVQGDDFVGGQPVFNGAFASSDLGCLTHGPVDALAPQEAPDGVGPVAESSGDGADTQASHIQLDRVVSVIVTDGFSGHVYNLTTLDGYFVSNGVYTGNTNGALNAGWYAGALEQQRQLGGSLMKRWIASRDTHVRPEHREADGQVVPLSSPFVVGGFPMLYPGDKSAPAHLVVNCRCTAAVVEP